MSGGGGGGSGGGVGGAILRQAAVKCKPRVILKVINVIEVQQNNNCFTDNSLVHMSYSNFKSLRSQLFLLMIKTKAMKHYKQLPLFPLKWFSSK